MTDQTDALAAWANSDAPTVRPDAAVLRGDAARQASLALLLEATEDSPEQHETVRRAAGRPALGGSSAAGPSPLWSIRVPPDLDRAFRQLADRQGRDLSELVRQAAAAYLAAQAA
jgi:hypothetical protein